tara:strand:- start:1088 stop:2752 length:1665 start_codon:yes stop_codon:yes gene_type:complete
MEIKNFNYGSNYISNSGDSRNIQILGDSGAIFSLEIQRTVGSTITFYDFTTETFTSTRKKLKNRKCTNGEANVIVNFPAGGLTAGNNPNKYDLYLYAQNELDTFHIPYVDARFADGSIDINNTIGSSSSVLQRVLYQYPDSVLTLTTISPSQNTGFDSGSGTNATFNLQAGNNTGFIPFTLTRTLASTKKGVIIKQPDIGDLAGFVTLTIGEPYFRDYPLSIDPPPENPTEGNITNLPLSNSTTFTMSEAEISSTGISTESTITGVGIDGINDSDGPVVVTGVNVETTTITVNKALTIPAAGTNAVIKVQELKYRRWNAGSSIHQLVPGLTVVAGADLAANTTIAGIFDETELTREVVQSDGSVEEESYFITNADIPAFDTLGQKPTIQYGLVSSQNGVFTLNSGQQLTGVRNTASKCFAHGADAIKTITGINVSLSDLKLEVAEVTTTVNDSDANGVDGLTSFDVASTSGILDDVSTVHGVNLNSGVATPVVTNISSNTITLTPGSHVLQNGQALTFKGAGRVFTLTGKIQITNMNPTGATLYFDLDRLITPS